jgi:hypothetical protein
MPTFPVYNAQRNINATPSAPLREGEAAAPFKMQQQVVGTMIDITQKWQETQDVVQATDAKGKYKTAWADILTRASSDPNFKDSDKYYKELNKVREQSLHGVENIAVKNALGQEFQFEGQINKFKLDEIFKQKEIDYTRSVALPTAIKGYQNGMITAMTPAEYDKEREGLFTEIERNRLAGIIDYGEAEKIKKNAMYGAAETAVYANPEGGMSQIDSGRYDLTSEEKSKLTTTARQIIKHRDELDDWKKKQSNIQGAIQLSQALHQRTLTHDMVKGLQQSGVIDSETAAIFDSIALKKGYEIPASTSLAQPDYFVRLIEDSNGDKVKVDKILKDAAKAYGDNKLGSNQYLYLIQQATESFDRQSKGLTGMSKQQAAMKYATDGLKAYANIMSKTPPALLYKLLMKFTDRFKPGDDPEKIKTEVVDEHLGEEIEKSKAELKPDGVLMVSPDGRRGMMPKDSVEKALKRGYKYAN